MRRSSSSSSSSGWLEPHHFLMMLLVAVLYSTAHHYFGAKDIRVGFEQDGSDLTVPRPVVVTGAETAQRTDGEHRKMVKEARCFDAKQLYEGPLPKLIWAKAALLGKLNRQDVGSSGIQRKPTLTSPEEAELQSAHTVRASIEEAQALPPTHMSRKLLRHSERLERLEREERERFENGSAENSYFGSGKLGKDPTVETSFLPDRDREAEEQAKRERLDRQWLHEQELIKNESLQITYGYWDGTGHRKSLQV